MKVHSWFGPGFAEVIYQRSLLIELERVGFRCKGEVERDVFYEDLLVGKR
ncbi:MAG: GxxExxY protein, partial [Bacteriovorax sp.]